MLFCFAKSNKNSLVNALAFKNRSVQSETHYVWAEVRVSLIGFYIQEKKQCFDVVRMRSYQRSCQISSFEDIFII